MHRTYYQIQQHTGYQYEPLQEGNFDTLAEAQACMAELERDMQWRDMRIAEYAETDSEHKMVQVVEYGAEGDDEDDE
jgi:hypothetical protein